MQIHALTTSFPSFHRPVRAAGEPVDTFVPSVDGERLRKLDFWMGLQTQTYFEKDSDPAPEIAKLKRAVGRGPVPDQYARLLTGLAHSCTIREHANLAPGHRYREPVEQDRAWARSCLDALQGWADRGQIKLQHKGKPLPRDADLLKLVTAGRPAVRDGVVEFHSAPPPPPPRIGALAEEILAELPPQEHVPAPGIDKLKALEPLEGTLVIGAMLDRFDLVTHEDDLDRVRKLVREPKLKEALQPHLQRIARVGSEAEARGRLSWNFMEGRHKVQLLEDLIRFHPETAEGDFYRRELVPFLQCGELNTAHAAVKLAGTRPDWTRETLDLYTQDPERKLTDQEHYLMHDALEKGLWQPDAAQQKWLLERLELEGHSVFRYEGPAEQFRYTIKSVKLAADQDPNAFGEPARDRLLERLLNDPHDSLPAALYREPNGVDSYRVMTHALSFLFPSESRLDRLEQELDGPRGEAALAILAGAPLDEARQQRLAALLEPDMLKEPPADRRDLDVRGRIAEQFRPVRMAALAPREAMQLAYRTPPDRGSNPPPVDRAVLAVVDRYDGPLLPLPNKPLTEFTPAELADLELNEKLAPGQGAKLVPKGLESNDPLLGGVLRRLRAAGVREALAQLKAGELTMEQRLLHLDTAKGSREAWQALRQGFPPGERLKKDAELRQAMEHLGDAPEAWQRFDRLLDLTGEKFPDAMNASRAFERALADGKSESEAWKAALKGWIYEDGGTGEPGLVVGTDGTHVRVGSVRVPIKKPEGR